MVMLGVGVGVRGTISDLVLQSVIQTILDIPDLNSKCSTEQSGGRRYSMRNRSEREKITKEK
jgi:hypothetical protein